MRASVLPRFEVLVGCPQPIVAAKLARCLAEATCECHGWIEPPYAEFHVPESIRHFWSPRLQLSFEDHPSGTLVRCTFRPEPGVWTGFVFAHSLLGTVALLGLSIGLAQWTLDQSPVAAIVTPIAGLLSLGLYFGALAGHRLGHEHMCMLRRELDGALGGADPVGERWDDPASDAKLEGGCGQE